MYLLGNDSQRQDTQFKINGDFIRILKRGTNFVMSCDSFCFKIL